MTGSRRSVTVLLALALVGNSACASGGGWDGPGTEHALRASLEEAYAEAPIEVRCADRVSVGESCAATIGALEVDLMLAENAEGDVAYRFADELLAASDVAALLSDRLGDELGGDPAIECGADPLIRPVAGSEVRCTATTGDRVHEVVAVFEDDAGTVRVVAIHPGS